MKLIINGNSHNIDVTTLAPLIVRASPHGRYFYVVNFDDCFTCATTEVKVNEYETLQMPYFPQLTGELVKKEIVRKYDDDEEIIQLTLDVDDFNERMVILEITPSDSNYSYYRAIYSRLECFETYIFHFDPDIYQIQHVIPNSEYKFDAFKIERI